MDTYWGPCQDIKKHDDAPKDGETWVKYCLTTLGDTRPMPYDWCEGFDWYEMLIDMIIIEERQLNFLITSSTILWIE